MLSAPPSNVTMEPISFNDGVPGPIGLDRWTGGRIARDHAGHAGGAGHEGGGAPGDIAQVDPLGRIGISVTEVGGEGLERDLRPIPADRRPQASAVPLRPG